MALIFIVCFAASLHLIQHHKLVRANLLHSAMMISRHLSKLFEDNRTWTVEVKNRFHYELEANMTHQGIFKSALHSQVYTRLDDAVVALSHLMDTANRFELASCRFNLGCCWCV